MSKETEKAAAEFEKNMSRMGNAAERLKLNTLGPLLKGLNTIVESGDRTAFGATRKRWTPTSRDDWRRRRSSATTSRLTRSRTPTN